MKTTVRACVELVNSGVASLSFAKVRSSFIVGAILQAAVPYSEEYERSRRKLELLYVKKGEDGSSLTYPNGNFVFLSSTDENKFREGVRELLDVEVELAAPLLKVGDLELVASATEGTKPRDIYTLLPFVDPVEILALRQQEAEHVSQPQGLPE